MKHLPTTAYYGEGHMMTVRSILIVDDEANQRFIVEQALRTLDLDWSIATAASASAALAALHEHTPDLIITDYNMPTMSGLDLIAQVRRLQIQSRVILMTAYSSPEIYDAAQSLAIDHYLTKPVAITDLRRVAAATLAEPPSA